MKVFITGATGLLGGELAKSLKDHVEELWLLKRPSSSRERSHELIDEEQDGVVHWVEGDITNPQCLHHEADWNYLTKEIDCIIHCAALYDLYGNKQRNFLTNVVGTQNLLYLASSCKKLDTLHFISSIAVAGDYVGEFPEDELDLGQQFSNPYAETKFESEFHIRRSKIAAKKRILEFPKKTGDNLGYRHFNFL